MTHVLFHTFRIHQYVIAEPWGVKWSFLSVYFQLNCLCNNRCVTSSDKCIMIVTKGKKWRSNFYRKSGSSFWWPMIKIFILGDHKWFPIIIRIFLAQLHKSKFLFLKNFPRLVTTTIMIMTMIMTDHLKKFLRPVITIVMIMTDYHH